MLVPTLVLIAALGLPLGWMAGLRPSWAAPPGDDGADPQPQLRQRLAGTYELVSYEFFPAGGETRRVEAIGRLNYDPAGNMAAQIMPLDWPERPPEAATPARGLGYVAYFGRYEIDPTEGKVTHHVQGSVNPRWVGGDQVRFFELSKDGLTLSLRSGGRTTARLVWRRLGAAGD